MREESIEKLARERAEKMAMQEAMANNIVIWFPLVFVAFIMMFSGAPTVIVVLFGTVALVAGIVSAIVTWKRAYEKCYKKCLAELSLLSGESSKNKK
ncbi:MAG: hypothetical protein QMD13_02800 [Candidatus Bathyarchaeia archaeon]|nr:hypothetical protein [Candidatus Bathyarchaeia archaeon]